MKFKALILLLLLSCQNKGNWINVQYLLKSNAFQINNFVIHSAIKEVSIAGGELDSIVFSNSFIEAMDTSDVDIIPFNLIVSYSGIIDTIFGISPHSPYQTNSTNILKKRFIITPNELRDRNFRLIANSYPKR